MTSIPVAICRFSYNKFKRFYLKRERLFVDFWLYFWNVHEIYNVLKNTKSILAQLLPKLLHPKEMLTEASKRSCFSTPFCNQRVNGFETLLMSAQHNYFPLFQQIRDKLSWKKSALVTFEIFLLFVNTLTPDDKCSRRYIQTFWQQVQAPLSQKEETFFRFFIAFLKCAWNLEHSQTKEEYPSLIITEINSSERDVYLSV